MHPQALSGTPCYLGGPTATRPDGGEVEAAAARQVERDEPVFPPVRLQRDVRVARVDDEPGVWAQLPAVRVRREPERRLTRRRVARRDDDPLSRPRCRLDDERNREAEDAPQRGR